MKCLNYDNCGTDDLRHGKPGTHVEVTGFASPRSAGGQNHVELRKETGRLLCAGCYAAMKATGGHLGTGLPEQGTLA